MTSSGSLFSTSTEPSSIVTLASTSGRAGLSRTKADAGTLDWLEENDRAVKERGRFLALVREHFGTDRGTDALWNDYRDQMQRPVPMEPVRSWSDVSC